MRRSYDLWNKVKKSLQHVVSGDTSGRSWFRAGEVHWCAIGVNIGQEIDGKGRDFARPVLVLKRVSPENFLGLPLTKNIKNLSGYYRYRDSCIVFEQARVYEF